MAIAMLLPSVFPKWFTPAGDSVLSGGTLEFYEVGTTTPKSVYADYQQNAAIGNVVTLDGAGDATIFLGAGGYKVILKDSLGAQIDLVDGIFGAGGVGAVPSTANFVFLLNYDELRALSTAVDVAYVAGRTEEGDGGEGWFQRRPGVTAHDDDGVFLASVGGSVEYRRIFDADIDPRWYGVKYWSTDDQKTRVDAMIQGSIETGAPVLVAQRIFLAQNTTILNSAVIHCTEAGHFHATGAVTLTFQAGSRFNGSGVCFSGALQPNFSAGTIDALRLSWMGGTDSEKWTRALASAVAKFPFLMDVSTSVTSDISVPANLALEPSRGAVLTFAGFANLTIAALDFTAPLQFLAFGAESYVGAVSIGSPVVYMEWFGGAVGNTGNQNAIPFKAACSAKRLDLLPGLLTYTVESTNPFTVSDFVTWNGNKSKLVLNQDITLLGIFLDDITLQGTGSITHSSCVATLSSCGIPLLSGPTYAKSSIILNADWISRAENSTLTYPGAIQGRIESTSFELRDSVNVLGEVQMMGCRVHKAGVSPTPVFVFADEIMASEFKATTFDVDSTLIYSENAGLVVEISGCMNPEWNNGQSVSNGIPRVNVYGSGVTNNQSMDSIDGFSLDNDTMLHITDDSTENVVVSSDASKWRASVSLSSDGEYITIGSDMILGSDIWSIDKTVRAIALAFFDTAWRYGGIIETEVIYPIGHATNPADQVVAAFVHPPCANVATPGVNSIGDGNYYCCEPVIFGESLPINPPQKTSTHLKFRVNAWAGQVDLRAVPESHATYTVSDIWGDGVTSVPDNTNSVIQEFGRFVIYNKTGTSILPAGTKIKVVYRYDLPNKDQFLRFFRNEYAFQNVGSSFYRSAPFVWQAVRVRCSLTGSYTGQTQLSIPFMFRDSDFNGVQASLARRASDAFMPVQWNGATLTVGWS